MKPGNETEGRVNMSCEELVDLLECKMPYSWDGLSRLLSLDPESQVIEFEQIVKHIMHGEDYAFGVIRVAHADSRLPNRRSLFLDGNSVELVKALLQDLDTSDLAEFAFNKAWLNTIAVNLITSSQVSNVFSFIVPCPPQDRERRGRPLTIDDYDVIMRHETSPVRGIGEGLKKAFEKQVQGDDIQTFGIIEDNSLMAWVRTSLAHGQFWRVDMMWTVPEHRRRGYCSEVLLTSIHELKLRNRKLLSPDVDMENVGSLAVWRYLQAGICSCLTIYQA